VLRGGAGGGVSEQAFYGLAAEILDTLCFLHERNVAHRDLKARGCRRALPWPGPQAVLC
jgi:serine/threonine protein kinase